MEILHIKDLTFTYPESHKPALDSVNLSVNQGELVLLCGKSGCGKTTLLRLLKPELSPHGELFGMVQFKGEDISSLDTKTSASKIGYVMQNPDAQIVTDKVWHELAFGLESLGLDNATMKIKQGEMAAYFGISNWYHQDTSTLSGGQKQLLNLASVMVMQPEVLILDEPCSQLDPVAAGEFITTIKRLNSELGLTVVVSEHHLEELFSYADKIVIMEDGKLEFCGTPKQAGEYVCENPDCAVFKGLPCALRIYSQLDMNSDSIPLTVRDGREFLQRSFSNTNCRKITRETSVNTNPIVTMKDCFFRYGKKSNDVLYDCNLTVNQGEIYGILGANGSGKTTLLSCVAGIERIYSGKIEIDGKLLGKYSQGSLYGRLLAYLPQNPADVFLRDTVYEDYSEAIKVLNISNGDELIEDTIKSVGLGETLLKRHPYDLSGGEQQKAAIGRLLLQSPKILLLDEASKGLDPQSKQALGELLISFKAKGITVIMVSHDIEFCAKYCDRCGLFFDGGVIATASSQEFFARNNFYTTSASRISSVLFDNAVLVEDVVMLCEKNGGRA